MNYCFGACLWSAWKRKEYDLDTQPSSQATLSTHIYTGASVSAEMEIKQITVQNLLLRGSLSHFIFNYFNIILKVILDLVDK